MEEVKSRISEKLITLCLSGHIDSNNAAAVEKEVLEAAPDAQKKPLVIDASGLKYISSAGLRVLLHLRKAHPGLKITGVSPEVYEIFDMTGFTQMMTIEKAYRVVSVEGCEEIGRGANGSIYRIDQDNVVKVYNNADALEDIQHEREVARTALILGIPTAISYDVVRVGDSYGSVFELLDAQSFSKILANEPEKMDWCVKEYVGLLKKIHGTLVPEGALPDIRERVISWAVFLQDHLPEEAGKKLMSLVEAVPHDDHMIHGDYHTKNVVKVGDEVLLIDMDTLAVGHPVFELASMFNAYVGFSEYNHENIKKFQGFDFETAQEFWHRSLAAYLGTDNPEEIRRVEDKARIVGYSRLIRRAIRRNLGETEDGRAVLELWTRELLELLETTDSLLFDPNELDIEAEADRLPEVIAFVESRLEAADCPMKTKMQIGVAVEEIFINIASYAYAPEKGRASIRMEVSGEPAEAVITFKDSGVPYDPVAKADPDITLPAKDRQIGGLGILMVKKSMDDVRYEYKDGQNILTMTKKLF